MDFTQSKTQRELNRKCKDFQDSNQSDYAPQSQKVYEKKAKKVGKKVQNKKKQNFNNSTWTLQENLLYKDFIRKNYNLFNLPRQERRAIKINVLISKFVKTRTSDQCRSHHQKMLIYHGDLSSIVEHIQALQEKTDEPKITQCLQAEEAQTVNTNSIEMKEIEYVKPVAPSLWECMVQDVWIAKE